MLKPSRCFLSMASVLAFAALASCDGPQPLDRAISPGDERAYAAMRSDPKETPKDAYLREKAAQTGVSLAEARRLDDALSATTNPFHARSDQSAVSRGAVIYEHECVVCHGVDADGHGPGMPVELASMNFHRFGMRADITAHGGAVKKWFRTIENGTTAKATSKEGSPVEVKMPAFSDRLAREQIWLVITYLQSLDCDLPTKPGEASP